MLTPFQKTVLGYLAEQTLRIKQQFADGENVAAQQKVIGNYAHAMHADLVAAGNKVQFSQTMLGNRDVAPTNPEFFNSIHALENFVGIVNAIDQKK